jgi:hypothetical protein
VLKTNNMKSIKLILNVALLVGVSACFYSCGGDDAEPAVVRDPSALVGKWAAVSLQLYDCANTSENITNTCGTGDYCATFQFNADGTLTEQLSGSSTVESGAYNAQEGLVSICANYKGCATWVFSVQGNQLKLEKFDITACNEIWLFNKL